MTIASLRILCKLEFPDDTVRFWDGSGGPFLDGNGDIWRPASIAEGGLENIETAINGEAWTLELGLIGITPEVANIAWQEAEGGQVIGSTVKILIQDCDENDQPVGEPEVKFTGRIDNIRFDDVVIDDKVVSSVIVECTNRFTLRTMTSGSVLSDVDQRARSAVLNPGADPDRFCERIPGLSEKTINWPAWN